MQSKTMAFIPEPQMRIHKMPAGIMQDDKATELFACIDTKRVFGVSQGQTIKFEDICPSKQAQLLEQLLNDKVALSDLKHLPQAEAIEQYAFCNYGACDHDPDFCEEGVLKPGDNFLCSMECQCIFWESKNITVDGKPLTPKKIQIVTLMASDLPDKSIADQLGISPSTLDTHKAQIFELFNCHSKPGVIRKAIAQKIIQ